MTVAIYYSDIFLQHDTGAHPESRARLEAIMSRLESAPDLGDVTFPEVLPTSPEIVKQTHTPSYVDAVARMASLGGDWLDGDTIVSPASWEAALHAAGAAIDAAEAVATGKFSSAFVAPRPPGHHATVGRGMGFCLFNNVALAAQHLVQNHLAERVAIVDVDVHHGNGTQDIFYQNRDVLAFSVHQSPLYPGTGHYSETGRGEGEGYTVNVPLPPGSGDAAYDYVIESVLPALLRRFQPDIVFIPCGYDLHWRDPLANMKATVPGFAGMVRRIKALADELCGGKIVCTLEGGYDLQALSAGVEATIRVLTGSPLEVQDPYGAPTNNGVLGREAAEPIVAAVRRTHNL